MIVALPKAGCSIPWAAIGGWLMSSSLEASVEFRVMPSGDDRWYWEVITGSRNGAMRGVADTEPAACQDAGNAARKAKLIP